MKSWLWKGMLAATIALPALSGMARAQSNDNDGCTNATLKGDYAFSVIDFILPQVVVGIGRFDGKGGFTQLITLAIAFGRPARPALEAARLAATRSILTARGAKRSS
jgi:hypothetical protein